MSFFSGSVDDGAEVLSVEDAPVISRPSVMSCEKSRTNVEAIG